MLKFNKIDTSQKAVTINWFIPKNERERRVSVCVCVCFEFPFHSWPVISPSNRHHIYRHQIRKRRRMNRKSEREKSQFSKAWNRSESRQHGYRTIYIYLYQSIHLYELRYHNIISACSHRHTLTNIFWLVKAKIIFIWYLSWCCAMFRNVVGIPFTGIGKRTSLPDYA